MIYNQLMTVEPFEAWAPSFLNGDKFASDKIDASDFYVLGVGENVDYNNDGYSDWFPLTAIELSITLPSN